MGDSTGHDSGRARALHSTSNGVGVGRSAGQGLRGRYGIVVCLAFFCRFLRIRFYLMVFHKHTRTPLYTYRASVGACV